MKSNVIELDMELDMARMEVQASADLMLRSMRETYRLIASAQQRVKRIAKTKATSGLAEAA